MHGGPRMTLQTQLVLRAMLVDPSQHHYGPELSKATGLKTGTLYPILARLEQAQWVASSWEDIDPSEAGRPARRYYRLTPVGATEARRVIEESIASLSLRPLPPT